MGSFHSSSSGVNSKTKIQRNNDNKNALTVADKKNTWILTDTDTDYKNDNTHKWTNS